MIACQKVQENPLYLFSGKAAYAIILLNTLSKEWQFSAAKRSKNIIQEV